MPPCNVSSSRNNSNSSSSSSSTTCHVCYSGRCRCHLMFRSAVQALLLPPLISHTPQLKQQQRRQQQAVAATAEQRVQHNARTAWPPPSRGRPMRPHHSGRPPRARQRIGRRRWCVCGSCSRALRWHSHRALSVHSEVGRICSCTHDVRRDS